MFNTLDFVYKTDPNSLFFYFSLVTFVRDLSPIIHYEIMNFNFSFINGILCDHFRSTKMSSVMLDE